MDRLIGAVVVAFVLAGCGAQAARVCEMFSDEGGDPVSKSSQTLQDLAWAFRVQANGAAEVRTARRMGLTLREVAEARAAKCPDGWGDPPTAAELGRAAAEIPLKVLGGG